MTEGVSVIQHKYIEVDTPTCDVTKTRAVVVKLEVGKL